MGSIFFRSREGESRRKEWGVDGQEGQGRGVAGGIICVHMCVALVVGGVGGRAGLKSQILNQFFGL